MSTAGILIIGNEVLSGKVQDENAPYLLRELRVQGVDVCRLNVIPDEVDLIADEVRSFSAAFDYVLTTGGVGPTHDDVTMESVAKAFGLELEIDPDMHQLLLNSIRDRAPNESELKMCQVPRGAQLIKSQDVWIPLVNIRNVYIFPGIPRLLQAKFHSARQHFRGEPFHLRKIYMSCVESDIAQNLHDLLSEFPELRLGSYPRTTDVDYRTLLTLESRDLAYVDRAVDSLVDRLPATKLLRVE